MNQENKQEKDRENNEKIFIDRLAHILVEQVLVEEENKEKANHIQTNRIETIN